MKVLGIVPARGGSRGIPRKNLAMLHGKPLIEWTLLLALASNLGSVIVSSDDELILKQAETISYNGRFAQTWKRPVKLARDHTPTIDVVRWQINQLDEKPDAVMVLQPTCPLTRVEDIDRAIELMERYQCDSVVSYVSVGANHPARMAHIAGQDRVFPIDSVSTFARRQDLEPVYIRSGDIYLTKREVLESGSMVGKDQRALVIPAERHMNIDDGLDLLVAAAKMEHLNACSG